MKLCYHWSCYERFLNRQRGLLWNRCAPLSFGVTFCLWERDSSTESNWDIKLSPGVQVFLVSVCDCVNTHQHLLGCGPGAQTGSSSTQTNILYQLLIVLVSFLNVGVWLSAYAWQKLCNQHTSTVWPLHSSFTLQGCVTQTCQSVLLFSLSVGSSPWDCSWSRRHWVLTLFVLTSLCPSETTLNKRVILSWGQFLEG